MTKTNKGPLPISKNGFLPGAGWPKRRTPFSVWLKLTRARKGMRQRDLADALGLRWQTVREWEAALKCPPLRRVPDIAAVLDAPARELYHKLGVLDPEEHTFLVATHEGRAVLKNMNTIMDKVKARGGPSMLTEAEHYPDIYAGRSMNPLRDELQFGESTDDTR